MSLSTATDGPCTCTTRTPRASRTVRAVAWPSGRQWPQVNGIDASLVSTITRSDGSKQLAINGLPLYLFASDSQAGEAKGQAVGGIWWVVGADGKKITTQPAGSGNGNGY